MRWIAATGLSNLVDRDPACLAGLLDQQDQRDQAQAHNREDTKVIDVREHRSLTLNVELQQGIGLLQRSRAAVRPQCGGGAMQHLLQARIRRVEVRRQPVLVELRPPVEHRRDV